MKGGSLSSSPCRRWACRKRCSILWWWPKCPACSCPPANENQNKHQNECQRDREGQGEERREKDADLKVAEHRIQLILGVGPLDFVGLGVGGVQASSHWLVRSASLLLIIFPIFVCVLIPRQAGASAHRGEPNNKHYEIPPGP